MSRGAQGMPPGLLPNEAAGTCRPRTSIQPPRAPVPALVNPALTWQPVSRIPGTSDLWQNHCGRDRIHGVKGVCGLRPSMPRAMSSVYGAMTGRQRHGGPVRRHAVMFGKRAKTAAESPLRLAFQGEAHRLPSTESQTIGTTRSFAKTGPGRSTSDQPEPNSTGVGLPAIGFLRTNPVHRDVGPPR